MTTIEPRLGGPLGEANLELVVSARRGVLVTIGPDELPRPVPFCYFARFDEAGRLVLHTPIDEKPKRADDPLALARVLDIQRDPRVVVLIDRWAEDWTRLAWVRLRGTATVIPPDGGTSDGGASDGAASDDQTGGERVTAIAALRAKYPQYVTHALEERPLIRIVIDSWRSWSATPSS